jgi:hypothetical protein
MLCHDGGASDGGWKQHRLLEFLPSCLLQLDVDAGNLLGSGGLYGTRARVLYVQEPVCAMGYVNLCVVVSC